MRDFAILLGLTINHREISRYQEYLQEYQGGKRNG